MTEVAVVILNYNGRNFLKQFLPSVIRYSSKAKIIVADNGSTDDSIQLLETEFVNQVNIIRIDTNLGFCGGYNYALKQVDAEYFVLLNSDVEVTHGWIEPILSVFKSDPSIAAAQPKILSYHNRNYFEYAGAAGGYIDTLGYPFCRGRIFETFEEDYGQYNDNIPIFWATGACLFIRAKQYHECGGLDEDFFAHMEEIDLCWQLNRKGLSVLYVGASTVYHVGGGTLAKSNPRKTYLNFRNGLFLLIKHTSASGLLWKLPIRVALDWIAALKSVLSGNLSDSVAIFRAHLHVIFGLGNLLKKRTQLQEQLRNFKVKHQYPKFMVWDYFIRNKRLFTELVLLKVPDSSSAQVPAHIHNKGKRQVNYKGRPKGEEGGIDKEQTN